MKKLFSLLSILILAALILACPVSASEEKTPKPSDTVGVYVTISNEKGELVHARVYHDVTDLDGDGIISVHDALTQAHKDDCDGGYLADHTYGDLSIRKLWRVDGRKYDVFSEGSRVLRLTEPIEEGDHIQAFVYTDEENASDRYSYFNKTELKLHEKDETITLYAYKTNEFGNLVSEPVKNAVITVNGEQTKIKTDKNGSFTLSYDDLQPMQYNVISAVTDEFPMVPPILTDIPLAERAPTPPDRNSTMVYLILIIVVAVPAIFGLRMLNEKLIKPKKKK